MNIQFQSGFWEWHVVVDGKVFFVFDDLSEDLELFHCLKELEGYTADLVNDMFSSIQRSLDSGDKTSYDLDTLDYLRENRQVLEHAMTEALAREYTANSRNIRPVF